MSFNPYSASSLDGPPTDAPKLPLGDQRLPFNAVLRSLPFSFAGGLLAATVWGFGATSVLLTLLQIHVLFGLLLGIAISCSLVFAGLCKQLSRTALTVRLSVPVIGCTLGMTMIPAAYTFYRNRGWHISGVHYPWIWALSLRVPTTLMVSTICMSLLAVEPLALKRLLRLFGLGLVFSELGMGAIDNLLRTGNSVSAHLTIRSIMLTLWFVSWIGSIVYEVSGQCQIPMTDLGSDTESTGRT